MLPPRRIRTALSRQTEEQRRGPAGSCPPAPRADGRSPPRREADEKLSKSIRAHFLDGLIPMEHETLRDG